MSRKIVLTVVVALAAPQAWAAAWPMNDGELVISETSLVDIYDNYARHSTNRTLLEEPGGSVVQVGPVRRWGFFLSAEYGLSDRLTAQLAVGYFVTQHLAIGDNTRDLTNAVPNTQYGIQDLTGSLKYLVWQHQGAAIFGVSPYLGFALPLQNYDTTVNNPLGDGVIALDFGLALSLAVPAASFFANLDGIYRARHRQLRAGQIHDQVQAVLEFGYFFTSKLSLRGMLRYYHSLGGEELTFANLPALAAQGLDAMQLYENPLAYNQIALFVGGGPWFQVNEHFGVGLTYVQAVWYRNHANVKTVLLSFSYSPQIGRRPEEPPVEDAEVPAEDTEVAPEPTAAPEAAPGR